MMIQVHDAKKKCYINIVKGLAIFLMIWGHCIQCCIPMNMDFFENPVFKTIYSFHMPLFMLISGYLFYFSFSKRDLRDLLIHRCQGLLQTIVVGGIFIYLATTGVYAVIKGDYRVLLNGKWLSSLSGLWFVWSVLGASIVLGIICKKVNKWYYQILLICFGGIFVCFLPNWQNNLYMYPYYAIGFYFAKYKDFILQKVGVFKYVGVIIYPIMLCFFDKKHYIYTSGIFSDDYTFQQYLGINCFRWVIGAAGSWCVLILIKSIYDFSVYKKYELSIFFRGMNKLGEKSLQIYALSVIFLSSYLYVGYPKVVSVFPQIETFWVNHIFIYNYVFTFVLAILYSVGLLLVVNLFEKYNVAKVIFGR